MSQTAYHKYLYVFKMLVPVIEQDDLFLIYTSHKYSLEALGETR